MSGSRGPLTSPFSVRGQKARRKSKGTLSSVPETPERPSWLPQGAQETWDSVLADLEAAGMQLARIDAHAIGMYCALLLEIQKATAAGDGKLLARLNRDLIAWANQIGATPAARQRMGVQPAKPGDPGNPWEELRRIVEAPRPRREERERNG